MSLVREHKSAQCLVWVEMAGHDMVRGSRVSPVQSRISPVIDECEPVRLRLGASVTTESATAAPVGALARR